MASNTFNIFIIFTIQYIQFIWYIHYTHGGLLLPPSLLLPSSFLLPNRSSTFYWSQLCEYLLCPHQYLLLHLPSLIFICSSSCQLLLRQEAEFIEECLHICGEKLFTKVFGDRQEVPQQFPRFVDEQRRENLDTRDGTGLTTPHLSDIITASAQ